MPTKAYAAYSTDTPLAPFVFKRRALRPDDVQIDILYCGVCHSDLHWARNDWGWSQYPVVPGHEIVGKVSAIGAAVTGFRPGDLVGVGCMVDSCQGCPACARGDEQYCAEGSTSTYGATDRNDGSMTQGGYSQRVVVRDRFVLRIPEGMDLKGAAPLLCAGITTWSPLRHWNVGPGSKVAVVGLGGLGHMALKLAKALGADVTLFTRSPGKEADARRLGADQVILSTDAAQMLQATSRFDVIIDTVPTVHDLNPYVPTLVPGGTLVLVGYLGPLEPFLNSTPMVLGRRTVAGSLIGGLRETQDLLDFCAARDITADVEVIDIANINDAFARMLNSDVKYRFVIDMASLAGA
jgi:uncharacterized zinc-type alcohol dehydrogenase-like protein